MLMEQTPNLPLKLSNIFFSYLANEVLIFTSAIINNLIDNYEFTTN